jgi:hypothetical protein
MLALVFAVLTIGPFFVPDEAQAKSFELLRAQVVADVQPDGSVVARRTTPTSSRTPSRADTVRSP